MVNKMKNLTLSKISETECCLWVDCTFLLRVSSSVTRLGDFWYFLAIKIITKVAQLFGDFLGSCENHRFLSQTGETTF